ncbi:fimbrial protein [Dyella acidiphila]|uniref:Type 1 fimbrial protein n=1 Tax=Dyella acidiphila TaxID=2775866 RepID=A0ABR9GBN3_9GAMM|nr:fimbrial protein [Dyella acidiphila]MBE1161436.1 type 1 fimbrial protein [Dyella acidiphila]
MKKFVSAAVIGGLLFAASAHASDGTITFTGSVTANSCTIKINGGSATATVALPAVSSSQLDAAGKTAGSTKITFDLADCVSGDAAATGAVKAFFEAGANVDVASGRLNNTASGTGAAKNVQLELVNSDDSVIKVGDVSSIKGGTLTAGAAPNDKKSSAQFAYAVRYFKSGADAVGAGTVSSSVTYSVVYQ